MSITIKIETHIEENQTKTNRIPTKNKDQSSDIQCKTESISTKNNMQQSTDYQKCDLYRRN